MSNQRIVISTAQGRVATIPGGTASMNIEANLPSSQARAKVSINVTSGTASARVKAQEPSSQKAASTSSVVTQGITCVKQHTVM